jgi:site-specific recombinase XerD
MVPGNDAGDGLQRATPESGAMERLRDRMTQELRVRGMAERTVEAYVHAMRLLTERTGLPPGHVTKEDLKAYLDDLLVERHVAPSTYAQHLAAMRFFYTHMRGIGVSPIL